MKLLAYYFRLPLRTPYGLSFAMLAHFDTVYVVLEGQGHRGFGEITPLPGYSWESLDSVREELQTMGKELKSGRPLSEVLLTTTTRSPFVASAVACACETWEEGEAKAFETPVSQGIPLVAYCGGETPEESRKKGVSLTAEGFRTLKLKVGRLSPWKESQRIRAVAAAVPADCRLRLDANQAYGFEDAMALCRELEGIEKVELLEQPFRSDQWVMHEKLAGKVRVPLMLDESILSKEDVLRAADCGARFVKFKLCKHLGMGGSVDVAKTAAEKGMGIVYGNGVQTALGNHLEARVYVHLGLQRAAETNGFLKLAESPGPHNLHLSEGTLLDDGLGEVGRFMRKTQPIWEAALPRGVEEMQSFTRVATSCDGHKHRA